VVVLGAGDGDERVQVLPGELVLDEDPAGGGGGFVDRLDLPHEVPEGGGAGHGDEAHLPADVPQRAVARPRRDPAREAAEQLHLAQPRLLVPRHRGRPRARAARVPRRGRAGPGGHHRRRRGRNQGNRRPRERWWRERG
jgi:hypothetical protein